LIVPIADALKDIGGRIRKPDLPYMHFVQHLQANGIVVGNNNIMHTKPEWWDDYQRNVTLPRVIQEKEEIEMTPKPIFYTSCGGA
jgi:hypothetical protein